MNMLYADPIYYKNHYHFGGNTIIPTKNFKFWSRRARNIIDELTFNRIDSCDIPEQVKQCTCELAEYLYMNEGNENKSSESIAGRSVTYNKNTVYNIVRRNLFITGLLYRGGNYVFERHRKRNNNTIHADNDISGDDISGGGTL